MREGKYLLKVCFKMAQKRDRTCSYNGKKVVEITSLGEFLQQHTQRGEKKANNSYHYNEQEFWSAPFEVFHQALCSDTTIGG